MKAVNPVKRPASLVSQDQKVLEMFEATLSALETWSPGRSAQLAELRRRMDLACDAGHITIREWRTLLDKTAVLQLNSLMHTAL